MWQRLTLFQKIIGLSLLSGIVPASLLAAHLLIIQRAQLQQLQAAWQIPATQITPLISQMNAQAAALLLYIVVALAIITAFITANLTRPLHDLMQSKDDPTAATLSFDAQSTDEFGQLGQLVNQLSSELDVLRNQLDAQVTERTALLERSALQYQAAAAVAESASSIRDQEQLLQSVVHLIQQQFGYYHAGIFIIDSANEYAVLRASNSPGGMQMLANGHKLSVAETSIVGACAATRQSRLARATGVDAVHFKNPYLPDTRSEVALPLQATERLWGVLDVQSLVEDDFSEQDIAILQTVANQLAIAIENANLHLENQRAVAELENLLQTSRQMYGELTREAWSKLLKTRPYSGYRCQTRPDGRIELLPIASPIISPDSPDARLYPGAVSEKDATLSMPIESPAQSDQHTLLLPIRVRDTIAGVMRLRKEAQSPPWSQAERDLIATLSEQLSAALESARLYDETRRRAERERLTSHITAQLRASNDPQAILQTAIKELRQALGVTRTHIEIKHPSSDDDVSNLIQLRAGEKTPPDALYPPSPVNQTNSQKKETGDND
jgi:GAF domain-containing protein/HAMP domain-containing protein